MKKAKEVKQQKLDNFELMKSFKDDGKHLHLSGFFILSSPPPPPRSLFIFNLDGKDEKKDSFTTKLVTKIVDNLQVYINKVHIRYEDVKNGQVCFVSVVSCCLFVCTCSLLLTSS